MIIEIPFWKEVNLLILRFFPNFLLNQGSTSNYYNYHIKIILIIFNLNFKLPVDINDLFAGLDNNARD